MFEVLALKRLGYSVLYSTGSKERMSQLYSMFRHLVVAVLADTSDIKDCFRDRDCVLMENNLRGIPAWKLFSFHFWGSVRRGIHHRKHAFLTGFRQTTPSAENGRSVQSL